MILGLLIRVVAMENLEYAYHVRDFLALRPLSRDLDRYVPIWNVSNQKSRMASRPEDFRLAPIESIGAKSCADVLDWDSVSEFTVHTEKGVTVHGMRVPFVGGGHHI